MRVYCFFFLSVLFLLTYSCTAEKKEISASFLPMQQKGKEKVVSTGAFGGGSFNKTEKITLRSASFILGEQNTLTLIVEGKSGGIEFVPDVVDFSRSWEKYNTLETSVRNINDFPIVVHFGIKGRWIRQMDSVRIESGKAVKISRSLDELPLLAPKDAPFTPSFITYEIITGNAEGGRLEINSLILSEKETMKYTPVVDRFGQRKKGNWKNKITNESGLYNSLNTTANTEAGPDQKDIYGGIITGEKKEVPGFFRCKNINGKWWFITPEGNIFWSLGVTGVRPKNTGSDVTSVTDREFMFEYLPERDGKYKDAWEGNDLFSFYYLNILRKYGSVGKWRENVFSRLSNWGLNTIGNWSEDSLLIQAEIPFTGSIVTRDKRFHLKGGLCDYFDPAWVNFVDSTMQVTAVYKNNRFLIGYFVDNEQDWGHGEYSGILSILPQESFARKEWVRLVRKYYSRLDLLNSRCNTTFATWEEVYMLNDSNLFPKLKNEIIEFETLFAEQYFKTIASALKRYDPNHLYLGCRFTRKLKPRHILKTAARYSDVITVNVYSFVEEEMLLWHDITRKPILIGEHHVPLKSERQFPPNYRCFDEEERRAYYVWYVQTWAKMPFSLGCHWYQFADQPLTGRSTDGECQTVGLVDVTDQPYIHLTESIRKVSGNMYRWHNE